MNRHVFLIPGFFGFANLGDFTYWGHVHRELTELLEAADMPATIHSVKSLPTASLRKRTRALVETIAAAVANEDAIVHLVGHSTGGLDARLLLTPAVDLDTELDVEAYARRVRSAVSVATPHHGAPIASFFSSLLGRQLLRLLSILTMTTLRVGEVPLTIWAEVAGLFALPHPLAGAAGTLATQLYRQLLARFDDDTGRQVRDLLAEVEHDQSLLTQLTNESMDLFNAAAGNREGVLYGSVVTRARAPEVANLLEIGAKPADQAQHAIYFALSHLATGYDYPEPDAQARRALIERRRHRTDSLPALGSMHCGGGRRSSRRHRPLQWRRQRPTRPAPLRLVDDLQQLPVRRVPRRVAAGGRVPGRGRRLSIGGTGLNRIEPPSVTKRVGQEIRIHTESFPAASRLPDHRQPGDVACSVLRGRC